MPNYNMVILDDDNLTITAGELMRLANSALVLMMGKQIDSDMMTVSMLTSYGFNGESYIFDFDGPTYVADSATDVIKGDK